MPKPITTNTLFYGDELPIARGTFKQAERVKDSDAKQKKMEL